MSSPLSSLLLTPTILFEEAQKEVIPIDRGKVKEDFAKSEANRKSVIENIGSKIFTFPDIGNQKKISVKLRDIYDPYNQSPFAELAAPYLDVARKVYLVALLKLKPSADESEGTKVISSEAAGAQKVKDAGGEDWPIAKSIKEKAEVKEFPLKDDGLPSDLRLMDASYFSRDVERFKPGAIDPVSRREIMSISIYSIDFQNQKFDYRGHLLDRAHPPSTDERERLFSFINANDLNHTDKKIEELAHHQYSTGVSYHLGELGCRNNFKDVLYWYGEAAKNGSFFANVALSTLFQTGSFEEGGPTVMTRNLKVAEDYLLKAISCIDSTLKTADHELGEYQKCKDLIFQLERDRVPNKRDLIPRILDTMPNPYSYLIAHRLAANVLFSYAVNLMEQEKVEEAPKYLKQAIDITTKVLNQISSLAREIIPLSEMSTLIPKLTNAEIILTQTKADSLFNLAACISADPNKNNSVKAHKEAIGYLREALRLYKGSRPELVIVPKINMCLEALNFHYKALQFDMSKEDVAEMGKFFEKEHDYLQKLSASKSDRVGATQPKIKRHRG